MDGAARIRRRTVAATLVIAAAGLAVIAGLGSDASATLLPDYRVFDGHPRGDREGIVYIEVSGKDLSRGRFKPKKVTRVVVRYVRASCWDQFGGEVGPHYRQNDLYGWRSMATHQHPIRIKRGSFKEEYVEDFTDDQGRDHVFTRLQIKGKITSRGRTRKHRSKLTATGTYQIQHSEVDIKAGFCGNKHPVKWTAKGTRVSPDAVPPS